MSVLCDGRPLQLKPLVTTESSTSPYSRSVRGYDDLWVFPVLSPLNKETPFHSSTNRYHHSISDHASRLSWTWWWGRFTDFDKSISRLVKALPNFTTLLACDRLPIIDSKSLFKYAILPHHWLKTCFSWANLSTGRQSCYRINFNS